MTKTTTKCKLCAKQDANSTHHLIPRSVIKKINKQSNLKNLTVSLCLDCHKAIHYHYFDHIMMSFKEGPDKFGQIKYVLLKDLLKKRHPEVNKEWRDYLKEFIENYDPDNEKMYPSKEKRKAREKELKKDVQALYADIKKKYAEARKLEQEEELEK